MVPNTLTSDPNLTQSAMKVALLLLQFCGKGRTECTAYVAHMAQALYPVGDEHGGIKLDSAVRNVQRGIALLRQLGYIEVEYRRGPNDRHNQQSVFRLLEPMLVERDDEPTRVSPQKPYIDSTPLTPQPEEDQAEQAAPATHHEDVKGEAEQAAPASHHDEEEQDGAPALRSASATLRPRHSAPSGADLLGSVCSPSGASATAVPALAMLRPVERRPSADILADAHRIAEASRRQKARRWGWRH